MGLTKTKRLKMNYNSRIILVFNLKKDSFIFKEGAEFFQVW